MAGAAENVTHLVPHQLFDADASGAEVLAGIEVFRVLREHLSDSCRHRQAQVGVNVDFGAASAAGDCPRKRRKGCAHAA